MLTKHKNALWNAIKESGLDPQQFQRKEIRIPEGNTFAIQVRATPLRFTVLEDSYANHFRFRYVRLTTTFREESWTSRHYDIDELIPHFKRWLDEDAKVYLQDISLPDLWLQMDALRATGISSTLISDHDFTEFSKEEKQQILIALKAFHQAVIENLNPTQKQTEFLNDRTKYLKDAVNRLNRFDWRGVAISTLISIAIGLSVDTQTGRLLFNLFEQAFRSVLRLPP